MSVNAVDAISREAATFLGKPGRIFVEGIWKDCGTGDQIEVIDPASGRVIGSSARGRAEDIHSAVMAARRSFESGVWRGLSANTRAGVLWRFGDLLEEHGDELSALEVANNGMPIARAEAMAAASASWLRHHAHLTVDVFGKNASGMVSSSQRRMHAYTALEPVGVAGLILPWNGPIGIFVVKVAAALAAGCSVVVKPAEATPMTALRLAELSLQAGVPPGVLNVVTGFGTEAGWPLVEHPEVDKISFTGSTAVGKEIARGATQTLKRVTLELGGKSPLIIFDDADLDAAIPVAAEAIFGNTGQVCSAGSRLFVHRSIYDRVISGIADIARSLRVGSGFDRSVEMGPLISARQRERVMQYVEVGRREGAELVVGGKALDREGYFVEPTVFAGVDPSMRVVREEIFGPVLVATPFDDMESVVREANDTRYGLASGLFTSSLDRAHLMAERVRAGAVWVNGYGTIHPAMPLGGFKESGWGRELGVDGVRGFLEHKSVFLHLTDR